MDKIKVRREQRCCIVQKKKKLQCKTVNSKVKTTLCSTGVA